MIYCKTTGCFWCIVGSFSRRENGEHGTRCIRLKNAIRHDVYIRREIWSRGVFTVVTPTVIFFTSRVISVFLVGTEIIRIMRFDNNRAVIASTVLTCRCHNENGIAAERSKHNSLCRPRDNGSKYRKLRTKCILIWLYTSSSGCSGETFDSRMRIFGFRLILCPTCRQRKRRRVIMIVRRTTRLRRMRIISEDTSAFVINIFPLVHIKQKTLLFSIRWTIYSTNGTIVHFDL